MSSSGSTIHCAAQTPIADRSSSGCSVRPHHHAVAVGMPALPASLQQRFPSGSFVLQHIHPDLALAALNSV